MQVRPVRMKESPATRLSTAGAPHHWAPSSPGGLGYTSSIILGQPGSDCIPTSRDRFSKAGKTILDPSMRTVHSPPKLNQWSPISACT
jgi:hypothetical protein